MGLTIDLIPQLYAYILVDSFKFRPSVGNERSGAA